MLPNQTDVMAKPATQQIAIGEMPRSSADIEIVYMPIEVFEAAAARLEKNNRPEKTKRTRNSTKLLCTVAISNAAAKSGCSKQLRLLAEGFGLGLLEVQVRFVVWMLGPRLAAE